MLLIAGDGRVSSEDLYHFGKKDILKLSFKHVPVACRARQLPVAMFDVDLFGVAIGALRVRESPGGKPSEPKFLCLLAGCKVVIVG